MNLYEQSDIETLFKVEPPLTELNKGFGYQGVILRNKLDDTLQCHICGNWFKGLSTHIYMAHKMKTRDYKIKYQLPLGHPLVSVSTSAKQSQQFKGFSSKFLKKRNPKKASNNRTKFEFTYMRTNASFHNKKGICEEQLYTRYLTICDLHGEEISSAKLAKCDESLRQAIIRRYKTWNNFKKNHKMSFVKKTKCYSSHELIAKLRNFYVKRNRIPRERDFRHISPSSQTIRNRFGSWNRALLTAGFDKGRIV